MKYFTYDILCNKMKNSETRLLLEKNIQEYENKFNNSIKTNLSKNFLSLYEKSNRLHDWYFEDLYAGNSGRFLSNRSKKGTITIKLSLYNGSDKRAVITYLNIDEFNISYKSPSEKRGFMLNGFERYYYDEFDLFSNNMIKHDILFENGNEISITFEAIKLNIFPLP